jgi:hypothetical protein
MRIALCTSSLESAQDGVGDYTRRLAAACSASGHECVLLGLADRHVERARDERQALLGVALETLRLPQSLTWEQRVAVARPWLKDRPPHWISLQFPAISFHSKGLVGNLAPYVVQLVDGGCALHVMLHERSLGAGTDMPPWHRLLVDSRRRRAMLLLLRELRPDAVHVNSDAGAQLLERYGVHARVLALPSDILAQPNDAPESSMAAIGEQFLSDIGAAASRAYEPRATSN